MTTLYYLSSGHHLNFQWVEVASCDRRLLLLLFLWSPWWQALTPPPLLLLLLLLLPKIDLRIPQLHRFSSVGVYTQPTFTYISMWTACVRKINVQWAMTTFKFVTCHQIIRPCKASELQTASLHHPRIDRNFKYDSKLKFTSLQILSKVDQCFTQLYGGWHIRNVNLSVSRSSEVHR
jgi:hypothetical protein